MSADQPATDANKQQEFDPETMFRITNPKDFLDPLGKKYKLLQETTVNDGKITSVSVKSVPNSTITSRMPNKKNKQKSTRANLTTINTEK